MPERLELLARNGMEMKDLLNRSLAKPTSGVACTCVGTKNIDTKNIHSQGIGAIDGFTVLRGPGAYATLDHEMEILYKLFRSSHADVCKIGGTTFRVAILQLFEDLRLEVIAPK